MIKIQTELPEAVAKLKRIVVFDKAHPLHLVQSHYSRHPSMSTTSSMCCHHHHRYYVIDEFWKWILKLEEFIRICKWTNQCWRCCIIAVSMRKRDRRRRRWWWITLHFSISTNTKNTHANNKQQQIETDLQQNRRGQNGSRAEVCSLQANSMSNRSMSTTLVSPLPKNKTNKMYQQIISDC